MMSLFRLAWSSKIRLPLLITVAFLALDVNLQVEINVFWAPIDREGEGRDNEDRQRRRQNGTDHQTRRGQILPAAPLAEVEDFGDDEYESDSNSTVSSIPSLDSSLEIHASAPHRYDFWDHGRRIPLHFDEREREDVIVEGEEHGENSEPSGILENNR